MLIGGLQKTTLIDYPGKIACVVFLAGCNFRCPFCYSAEIVLPEKILRQPTISEEKFFAFLKDKVGMLDGVVVCGGEPTLNEDLPNFIKKIKNLGFLVKLDTNGSNPAMLKKLLKGNFLDYVAMDIKAKPENYKKVGCGASDFQKVEESVKELKKNNIAFEFRTTMVPGLVSASDMPQIAKWIGGLDVPYYLQNFRPDKTLDPSLMSLSPYTDQEIKEAEQAAKPYFKSVKVRNYI
ncbi:MAG: anaerobic ribonucleoside-triphosphate reductase activating protein [Candidatus Paceibacterota bacterium]